jgi:putative endonuclease
LSRLLAWTLSGPLSWIDSLRYAALRGRRRSERSLGRRGEDLAHRYLQKQGFRILARNWTGPQLAEVDIVAEQDGRTVFVEVKSRAGVEFGSPERAMDDLKIVVQRRAARAWARRAGIEATTIRFDLVTVVFTEPPRIEHFPDAWSFKH